MSAARAADRARPGLTRRTLPVMTPLGSVVVGLVIAAIDVRIGGFDLISDPVGWALALWGLSRIRGLHRGLEVAAGAAVVGLVASLPQAVATPGPLVTAVDTVVSVVLTFSTCTALMALLPDPGPRVWADRVRWADLALGAVSLSLGLTFSGLTPPIGLAVLAIPLVVVAILVLIAFLLLLWRHRHLVPPVPVGLSRM